MYFRLNGMISYKGGDGGPHVSDFGGVKSLT